MRYRVSMFAALLSTALPCFRKGETVRSAERTSPRVREVIPGPVGRELKNQPQIEADQEFEKVSHLSPTEVRDRWNGLTNEGLSEDKISMLRDALLRRLVETEGIEEGLLLVCALQKGGNRSTLIEAAFEYSKAPLAELFRVRASLQDPNDREFAYYELEYASRVNGRFTFQDLEGIDLRNGRDWKILGGAVSFLVEDVRKRYGFNDTASGSDADLQLKGIYREVQDAVSKGNITEEQARAALVRMTIYPFVCWELLQQEGGSILDADRDRIIGNMGSNRPKESIALLLKDGAARQGDFGVLFESWLNDDVQAPKDWFAGNGASLPQAVASEILSSFASSEAASGEIDKAREWVERISDPEIKKMAEAKVWEAEREVLLAEVGKDPRGTIELILSGSSRFADHWLEEAAGAWVESDFDAAEQWSENWKPLPREKVQYLAAAFANHALKQGDVASASQWAEMIQDPGMKQKLRTNIERAESASK